MINISRFTIKYSLSILLINISHGIFYSSNSKIMTEYRERNPALFSEQQELLIKKSIDIKSTGESINPDVYIINSDTRIFISVNGIEESLDLFILLRAKHARQYIQEQLVNTKCLLDSVENKLTVLQQQYYKEKSRENRNILTIQDLDDAIPPQSKSSIGTIFSDAA